MGLDMYLSAKRYLWSKDRESVKVEGIPMPFELKELKCEAAYWRKANQIHKWFVDNVQDGEDECNPYFVSIENLQKLLEVCKTVKEDPSKIPELLPPCEGFFFGSQEVDQYYFEDIDHTIASLTRILSLDLDGWEFEYQSSW